VPVGPVGPELPRVVMEKSRETIDCTSDDPQLKIPLDENIERIASVVNEAAAAFAADDYFEAAKLRYWRRRIEEGIFEKIGSVE